MLEKIIEMGCEHFDACERGHVPQLDGGVCRRGGYYLVHWRKLHTPYPCEGGDDDGGDGDGGDEDGGDGDGGDKK